MRELATLLEKLGEDFPKAEQKALAKLYNRLESYIDTPTDPKHILRMAPFASNAHLVNTVLEALRQYNYPEKSGYPFDIISYWYCISLLALSEQQEANDFVRNLASDFLQQEHSELWLFRRFFENMPNDEYAEIGTQIIEHFLELQNTLESYQWAKSIGLILPTDNNWRISFEISTSGKFQCSKPYPTAEEEKLISMNVSLYPLSWKNQCWEIKLRNPNNSINAWWPTSSTNTIKLERKWRDYTMKTTPSLRNLKLTIKEIETAFDIQFNRKFCLKTFSGKIGNRNAVQKWLLEE